jgi:hypothetical protein
MLTAMGEMDLANIRFLCLELFVYCSSEIGYYLVGLFVGGISNFLLSCMHSMREYCE